MTGAINEAGEANDIVNPFLISNAYFQSWCSLSLICILSTVIYFL
jgi:hypothetical protein